MLALVARVEPLEYGQRTSIPNLAQRVHRPVALRQGVLLRLDKRQKGLHVIAGKLLRRSNAELVGVRLDPPDKPGEPRVQEKNDRERENGPPVTQTAKAARFFPLAYSVHALSFCPPSRGRRLMRQARLQAPSGRRSFLTRRCDR